MNRLRVSSIGLLAAWIGGTALAHEGQVPGGMPRLDHIYVIMMENHSYQQVVGNPAMPFINGLIGAGKASVATNYFAVGHPSLTNYLEVVGGSNFGVRSDGSPDWHNNGCSPNIATGIPNADNSGGNAPYPISTTAICPIFGTGKDAVTEAVDNWNETAPPVFNFLANIDGIRSVPAATTVGRMIGDQLASAGLSWKTYQENLPVTGADKINNSNGTATNLTTFDPTKPLSPSNLPPLTNSSPCPGAPITPCPALLQAYAVKHNPFAYFRSVQEGSDPRNSLKNMVGFDGDHGLYADLARGDVPSLAYIVPNQCDDQHGRGNGDAFCQFDQGIAALNNLTDGTQVGLNPGLSAQADTTIERIVRAIRSSPAWERGGSAIVIVWDENDYSGLATALPPNTAYPDGNQNRVVLTVETNGHGTRSVHSTKFYDSFSLLKSMEGAFRLPCLNHACDSDVNVMSDLFNSEHGW
jgi:phosphatidylinositol-3-phosphatase